MSHASHEPGPHDGPAVLHESYDAPHHGRTEDAWDTVARVSFVLFAAVFVAAIFYYCGVLFLAAND